MRHRLTVAIAIACLVAFGAGFISALSLESADAANPPSSAYVSADVENLRAAPNGKKIGTLHKGTQLNVTKEQGDWIQVSVSGWVWKSSTTDDRTNKNESATQYWINSNSNKRHNASCRWYGNTKNGYYTTDRKGSACGICGG